MGVSRTTLGSVTVLGAIGDFTGGDETDRLRDVILGEAAAGNLLLILDLASCSMMNSSGMSVLVEAYRNYAGRGGEIRLCGLQPRMVHQLSTVRLIGLIGHDDTVDDAVAAFDRRTAGT